MKKLICKLFGHNYQPQETDIVFLKAFNIERCKRCGVMKKPQSKGNGKTITFKKYGGG